MTPLEPRRLLNVRLGFRPLNRYAPGLRQSSPPDPGRARSPRAGGSVARNRNQRWQMSSSALYERVRRPRRAPRSWRGAHRPTKNCDGPREYCVRVRRSPRDVPPPTRGSMLCHSPAALSGFGSVAVARLPPSVSVSLPPVPEHVHPAAVTRPEGLGVSAQAYVPETRARRCAPTAQLNLSLSKVFHVDVRG